MSKNRFYNSHSPFKINLPNTSKDANITSDWYRESKQQRMYINDLPISEYAKVFNNFKTKQDIESFFRKVVLSKIMDNAKKEEMISFLTKTFHQGGLMYPVTSAITTSMIKNDAFIATTVQDSIKLETRIISTPQGFRVQECSKLEKLYILDDAPEDIQSQTMNNFLYPQEGFDYVILAKGTIHVDFSKDANQPDLIVEDNAINFGQYHIQKLFDNRNLWQIIVDFLKNILGLNLVEDLNTQANTMCF